MKKNEFKELFLLIKYISKSIKISKNNAANFLLRIFEKSKLFDLPLENQLMIIDNLIDYFNCIVFQVDKINKINQKKINNNLSAKEILSHIDKKTSELVSLHKNIKVL